MLAAAIAGKKTAGVSAGGASFSREGRLVAYERLANYPVYVTIERTRASIIGEWLETMAGYAAIRGPPALGPVLLSPLAPLRTPPGQHAFGAARVAISR